MPQPKKERFSYRRLSCSNRVKRPADTFCCRACQHEHEYEAYIADWLAGRVDGQRAGVLVSRYVRRYVKRTQGEQCAICGWAEVNSHTNSIPLHLDHIDGNWTNNRPENLRLLCPNHHALTSTYGAQNRGKGRPFVVYKRAPV